MFNTHWRGGCAAGNEPHLWIVTFSPIEQKAFISEPWSAEEHDFIAIYTINNNR